jgi:hypothetical protein
MSELGWPTAARLEFGTLDGIIGCVVADMGVTLLPRAVAERSDQAGMVRMHTWNSPPASAGRDSVHSPPRRTRGHGAPQLPCVPEVERLSVAA